MRSIFKVGHYQTGDFVQIWTDVYSLSRQRGVVKNIYLMN